MKAALIVMTILGCDDSVTQCHYIDTVKHTWQTVALCDAQSEAQINRFQNSNYPVVVAVCESNSDQQNADLHDDLSAAATQQASVPQPAPSTEPSPLETEPRGLAARTLAMLKRNLPEASALRQTMVKPFRFAEHGYSWVVRKFSN